MQRLTVNIALCPGIFKYGKEISGILADPAFMPAKALRKLDCTSRFPGMLVGSGRFLAGKGGCSSRVFVPKTQIK